MTQLTALVHIRTAVFSFSYPLPPPPNHHLPLFPLFPFVLPCVCSWASFPDGHLPFPCSPFYDQFSESLRSLSHALGWLYSWQKLPLLYILA
ncbi:hypothetical protein [Phaffia rhodozyma]|uniref:Uncharacterized protein n=1 Tax=Phaffia rhodozyma TaxID=264483 RepID=A0A0F7STS5_PHARH|nr:hypothetical protein [Phaffia rhodozyma]